jgi:hypothetical protein
MTNRERNVKTLLCEKADRPPWVHWLGFAPWGKTHRRWKAESGIADLNIVRSTPASTFLTCGAWYDQHVIALPPEQKGEPFAVPGLSVEGNGSAWFDDIELTEVKP